MPLSEDMHSLTQSIIASQEARAFGLSAVRASAAGQRQAARAEIQDRARAEAQRTAGFRSWMKQVSAERQAMASSLKDHLAQCHSERQAMASSQKDHLAQCHNDRLRVVDERHAQASAWLRGVATARSVAHADWLHMAETLRGIRGRDMARVTKVPPASQAEEVSEAEAVTRVQVGQVTPEFSSLRSRAFEYLAGRPDGTRLTELEQAIVISRIQMARIVRSLMDEGKAEKRGQLYFAV